MLPIDLDELRCLAALHRLARVQLAAGALGFPAAGFDEKLRSLEAKLGVKLVNRHHRWVSLTEQGVAMAVAAEIAAELLYAGAGQIGAGDPARNRLRLPNKQPVTPAQRVSRRRRAPLAQAAA